MGQRRRRPAATGVCTPAAPCSACCKRRQDHLLDPPGPVLRWVVHARQHLRAAAWSRAYMETSAIHRPLRARLQTQGASLVRWASTFARTWSCAEAANDRLPAKRRQSLHIQEGTTPQREQARRVSACSTAQHASRPLWFLQGVPTVAAGRCISSAEQGLYRAAAHTDPIELQAPTLAHAFSGSPGGLQGNQDAAGVAEQQARARQRSSGGGGQQRCSSRRSTPLLTCPARRPRATAALPPSMRASCWLMRPPPQWWWWT